MSQLERVFGEFKTSKGSGADGIANYFLKIGLPVIAESLCDMFNLSIETGVFPDTGKLQEWLLFLKVVSQMIVLITDQFSATVSFQSFRKADLQPADLRLP